MTLKNRYCLKNKSIGVWLMTNYEYKQYMSNRSRLISLKKRQVSVYAYAEIPEKIKPPKTIDKYEFTGMLLSY
jgi:hypothetical protein